MCLGGVVLPRAVSPRRHPLRIYALLETVPVVEPSDAKEALDFTQMAFDLSEQFDTPVIVRGTTRLSHTRSPVAIGERKEAPARNFIEKPSKNVMIPAYARPRHGAVIERGAVGDSIGAPVGFRWAPPPGSLPGGTWSIVVIHQEKCSQRQTRRRHASA